MEHLNFKRIVLNTGINGVIVGTTESHQSNSNFSVALLENDEYTYFDNVDCQYGLVEIKDDLSKQSVSDELAKFLDSVANGIFEKINCKYVQHYTK